MRTPEFAVASLVALALSVSLALPASAQTLTRLTLDTSGGESDGGSTLNSISFDGRFVVFQSSATDLVASDTNGANLDVFLLDRQSGVIELVSLDNSGAQHLVGSHSAAVSGDGRLVAFLSDGLDAGDTDFSDDLYLRDRVAGTTSWITTTNDLEEPGAPSFSDDGTALSYTSHPYFWGHTSVHVRKLTTGQQWHWWGFSGGTYGSMATYSGGVLRDGRNVIVTWSSYDGYNSHSGTFKFDTQTGNTTSPFAGGVPVYGANYDASFVLVQGASYGLYRLLHVQSGVSHDLAPTINGAAPNGYLGGVRISDDGRYVAYTSTATNLVAGDTNGKTDAFVRDVAGHATVRVSLSNTGAQTNDSCLVAAMTADGSEVIFDSLATNLLPGDTNGVSDVFARTNCFAHFADADGDGYGAGVSQLLCVPPPAGFVASSSDCDDSDPARHPDAVEICNGIDDDCDGAIDDGLVFAWFRDFDGDGFGDALAPITTCAPPAGYVANALDCDDALASVNPGATEVCNGIDDDCDGQTDEGLTTTYYPDNDGDAFGDGAAPLAACSQPAGYVLNPNDCDDSLASVHPGAAELCNGIDDDCDGAVDEGFQGAAYCTTSYSANGCVPAISATGSPRVSQTSGFTVRVDQVEGQRNGLVYYGSAATAAQFAPLNPSTLCVASPRQRMSASSSGGTAGSCNGVLATDYLAWTTAHPGALLTPLTAGQVVYFQAWMREPSFPKASILSGGWSVTLQP